MLIKVIADEALMNSLRRVVIHTLNILNFITIGMKDSIRFKNHRFQYSKRS